jgi:hypothetical protein
VSLLLAVALISPVVDGVGIMSIMRLLPRRPGSMPVRGRDSTAGRLACH